MSSDEKAELRRRIVEYYANAIQNIWKGLFEDGVLDDEDHERVAFARTVCGDITSALKGCAKIKD